jgi:EpsI family protein
LALQAGAMHMLSITERDLPIPPLQNLPAQYGAWQLSSEQSLEPEVEQYLKPDSYILRNYGNSAENSSINLFVAYFKSLQNSYGPHSPKVCLPGSGWLIRSSRIRSLSVPGRPEGIPVNEYVMEKNSDRILVLYWYQNDRHVWAEEFRAKFTLLPDLIRYKRSDVSLVRLVAPVRGADASQELAECQRFARLIFPRLVSSLRVAD